MNTFTKVQVKNIIANETTKLTKLVEIYNSVADKQIKKFQSKAVGIKRITAIMDKFADEAVNLTKTTSFGKTEKTTTRKGKTKGAMVAFNTMLELRDQLRDGSESKIILKIQRNGNKEKHVNGTNFHGVDGVLRDMIHCKGKVFFRQIESNTMYMLENNNVQTVSLDMISEMCK